MHWRQGARNREDDSRPVFARIGAFLSEHRLEPTPANYAFVHAAFSHPDGPVAHAIATLTDGGVRLTSNDVERLGGELDAIARNTESRAQGLVAQTQLQLENFADLVQAFSNETHEFGRDMIESAAAIYAEPEGADTPMARIAAMMIARIQRTEAKLVETTREADELREKLEHARDNARKDPLTGLPNRRALEDAYAARIAEGQALCIAMCDVDHFKAVNDSFGHAVGDRVLRAIGSTLDANCSGHLVCRYGGEEFAILIASDDLSAALEIVDTARATIAGKQYRMRETDTPLGAITLSAGLTKVANDDSFQSALGRADRLLYAAKKAGRNCTFGDEKLNMAENAIHLA